MILRVFLIAIGTVVMAFGGWTLYETIPQSTFANLGIWIVAGVLIHDILLAGLVAAGGWAIGRLIPARFRAYVQSGFIVAGVLVIMAIPVLIAGGRQPDNPSLLPLDYPRNLAIVLGLIAIGTVLTAVVRERMSRSSVKGDKDPAQ
ncbi:MAG: hypothetical protein K0U64_12070 [Actinomycetia bacterium]|nr:hypothetical protein [Actinomycetes bacterium]